MPALTLKSVARAATNAGTEALNNAGQLFQSAIGKFKNAAQPFEDASQYKYTEAGKVNTQDIIAQLTGAGSVDAARQFQEQGVGAFDGQYGKNFDREKVLSTLTNLDNSTFDRLKEDTAIEFDPINRDYANRIASIRDRGADYENLRKEIANNPNNPNGAKLLQELDARITFGDTARTAQLNRSSTERNERKRSAKQQIESSPFFSEPSPGSKRVDAQNGGGFGRLTGRIDILNNAMDDFGKSKDVSVTEANAFKKELQAAHGLDANTVVAQLMQVADPKDTGYEKKLTDALVKRGYKPTEVNAGITNYNKATGETKRAAEAKRQQIRQEAIADATTLRANMREEDLSNPTNLVKLATALFPESDWLSYDESHSFLKSFAEAKSLYGLTNTQTADLALKYAEDVDEFNEAGFMAAAKKASSTSNIQTINEQIKLLQEQAAKLRNR